MPLKCHGRRAGTTHYCDRRGFYELCSIHPQAKENFSHGVCCGGVPRARPKPARWGDAHPGTVASEPSREHIIGMRMSMMPTSRCCPSPSLRIECTGVATARARPLRRFGALAPLGPVPKAAVASYLHPPPGHQTCPPPAKVQGDAAAKVDACKNAKLHRCCHTCRLTLTIHLATDFQQPKAKRMLPLPDSAAPVPRRSDLSTPTC